MIMQHDQEFLNHYFSTIWVPKNNSISDPDTIVKCIKEEEWLLDVGCGRNPFKKLHANTIGVDPAFDEADFKSTIESFEFSQFQFDVATCLGSINFGTKDIIDNQIKKVVSLLKPTARIYWRLNPGRHDHNNQQCYSIPFFNWDFETLLEFANKYGFDQVNEQEEKQTDKLRLYAEWKRTV
jgi:hypothetical protein